MTQPGAASPGLAVPITVAIPSTRYPSLAWLVVAALTLGARRVKGTSR